MGFNRYAGASCGRCGLGELGWNASFAADMPLKAPPTVVSRWICTPSSTCRSRMRTSRRAVSCDEHGPHTQILAGLSADVYKSKTGFINSSASTSYAGTTSGASRTIPVGSWMSSTGPSHERQIRAEWKFGVEY